MASSSSPRLGSSTEQEGERELNMTAHHSILDCRCQEASCLTFHAAMPGYHWQTMNQNKPSLPSLSCISQMVTAVRTNTNSPFIPASPMRYNPFPTPLCLRLLLVQVPPRVGWDLDTSPKGLVQMQSLRCVLQGTAPE